jgi:predicted small secreted protein
LPARDDDWENRLRLSVVPNRRRLRVALALLAVVGAVLLLSSCAAGPNTAAGTGEDPAGFWLGLWHGIILPVTFVISLFTDTVGVYEIANNGNWYDFGFFVGAAMSVGGSGGAGVRARKRS